LADCGQLPLRPYPQNSRSPGPIAETIRLVYHAPMRAFDALDAPEPPIWRQFGPVLTAGRGSSRRPDDESPGS